MTLTVSVISDFRREKAKNCAHLGYYAASISNFLQTFRDNLSVPSSGFKNSSPKIFLNPEGRTDFFFLKRG